ncbi:hypothetical protein FHW96_001260 [Novosphingobium sp. SG751A]|uniref:hypothetical protein n=1 Tax=Novosphingobium sp. SG751A TaxID=2587000 RepID=UPI00155176B9|nr:hypothetical protein [Novosphingobium sp. SG751A]NOW45105.1 hypothetical protein [Novosphingobium sp. SG751A]
MMLSVDGAKPVEMHLPSTVPNYFGQDGVGIGRDTGTAISRDISMPLRFSGEMGPVLIDLH